MVELEIKSAMLCSTNIDRLIKLNGGLNNLVIGEKLDGVRCLSQSRVARHGTRSSGLEIPAEFGFNHFSRARKEYANFNCFDIDLNMVARSLAHRIGTHPILDGEVIDASGSAGGDFQELSRNLHRKADVDTSNMEFHLFDFTVPHLPLRLKWIQRYKLLCDAVDFLHQRCDEFGKTPNVHIIRHGIRSFKSKQELIDLADAAIANGREGLVVKLPMSLYENRRSPSWVKLTATETLDLPVIDYLEGSGKLAGHLGKFVCRLPDGSTVNVGPGKATHAMLKEWWENSELVPKMIEVGFKGYTKDGKLRHPRFLRSRDDKFGEEAA